MEGVMIKYNNSLEGGAQKATDLSPYGMGGGALMQV